jgi:hypothetical protein
MTTPIGINRDQTDSGPGIHRLRDLPREGRMHRGQRKRSIRLLLTAAAPDSAAVPPLRGSGKCPRCLGKGGVLAFEPYIRVRAESTRPASISMAAFTGAPWRFIYIPHKILWRTFEAQRGWVTWRIHKHYKQEGGECALFGHIVGTSGSVRRNRASSLM